MGEMQDQGLKNIESLNLRKKYSALLTILINVKTTNRQNNLRLLNMPEKEGKDMPVMTFLPNEMELKTEDFERAHRIDQLRTAQNTLGPLCLGYTLSEETADFETMQKKTRRM